jgi:hypothetical protein
VVVWELSRPPALTHERIEVAIWSEEVGFVQRHAAGFREGQPKDLLRVLE